MKPEAHYNTGPNELYLDVRLLQNLSGTAKWGKVLAVLGFILSGFILVFGLFMQQMLQSPGRAERVADVGLSGFTIVVYAFVALVYFFPSLYLYNFASGMQQGVQERSRQKVGKAIGKLRVLFKFLVIMLLLFLVLFAISLVMLGTGLSDFSLQ
ncbi:hypothetical protein [Pontibacter mangrovi]|uniref:Uncharacterized protein n=1 Tax=Pontibacter mangrovi TaxID=2589816 RepID=A0A501W9K0_9BACT|nr:hypothetical protein [Pontibacter mangrovi]TPE45422.1 hypothetical protein FJM65_05170 [Pontibacter mangrovi]